MMHHYILLKVVTTSSPCTAVPNFSSFPEFSPQSPVNFSPSSPRLCPWPADPAFLIFAVAIHRGDMLAVIGGAPGEVVSRRGVPAVLCRVVQPAEILGMVIPVVGENVKAHAPVHLRRILGIAPGKDAHELQQHMVIYGRGTSVCFQNSGGRQHMTANHLTGSLLPVKTPHGKLTAATPGRQQPGFRNHNATVYIFLFHAFYLRHPPESREKGLMAKPSSSQASA